jgi:hypothetical protein
MRRNLKETFKLRIVGLEIITQFQKELQIIGTFLLIDNKARTDKVIILRSWLIILSLQDKIWIYFKVIEGLQEWEAILETSQIHTINNSK